MVIFVILVYSHIVRPHTRVSLLFIFSIGMLMKCLLSSRLNLGIGIQESSTHADTNEKPRFRRNDIVKQAGIPKWPRAPC